MTANRPPKGAPRSGTVTTAPADWPDVETLFGMRGEPSRCWCRWFVLAGSDWKESTPEQRKKLLKERFDDDGPAPGVLAFRDGNPVGWCAVEPRACYPRVLNSRLLQQSASAADQDSSVWAVTCFVVAPSERRSGVATALLRAAVDHALGNGAEAVEGYPVDTAQRPNAG